MGSSKPPVHLLVKKGIAACGAPSYKRATTDWRLVTCNNCNRSIHMADAEAAAQLQPKRSVTERER